MITVDATVLVRRPAQEVFAFLADFRHDLQWRSQLVGVERTSAQGGLGGTWRQMAWAGPRRVTSEYAVTVYQPPHRLSFRSTAGPADVAGDYQLQPDGDSTRVAFTASFQPRGLLRTLEPALDPLVRLGARADLRRLATVLQDRRAGELPA